MSYLYLAPRLQRPLQIECPHYDPLPNTRRCRQYESDGSCNRPDRRFCHDWLRLNGEQLPGFPGFGPDDYERMLGDEDFDWFGNRLPGTPIRRKAAAAAAAAAAKSKSTPAAFALATAVPSQATAAPVVSFTPEDVASFKALRVEIHMTSPTLGDFWLVPEYTDARRREIVPEHAATIADLLAAFPGAKVAALEATNPDSVAGDQ